MLCVLPPCPSFLLLKAQKDLYVCETFQVEGWKCVHCADLWLEAEMNSDGFRPVFFPFSDIF